MTDRWTTLQQRLTAAQARKRRRERLATLALLAGGALLAFFGLFLLDWLFAFPAVVRLLLTTAALAIFGGWLPRRHRASLFPRPQNFVEIARAAEACADRAGSGLHSVLVSAVEFAAQPGLPGAPALKEWVVSEAQRDPFDPRRLPLAEAALLRRGRLLAAAALLTYAGWALAGPHSLRTFWLRAVGGHAAYLTRTRILSLEAPSVVAQFKPVTVRLRAGGVIPTQGRLTVKYEGEARFNLPLAPIPEQPGEFTAVLQEPAKSVRLVARLGDAESEALTVRVVKPAFVEKGTMAVRPPAYTGLPPYNRPFGDVELPAGSQADLRITPDRPVRACELELDGKRLPMAADGNGYLAPNLDLRETARYTVRLVDADGIENEDRLLYTLGVRPDLAPEVTIGRPDNGAVYATVSQVRWTAAVTDDYGLTSLELHYAVMVETESGERQKLREGTAASFEWPDNPRERREAGLLQLAALNLQPGQILVLQARAADRCTTRPKGQEKGLSAEVALRIVSPQELRLLLEEEMAALGKMVEDVTEDMKRQKETLGKELRGESWR
ncbi:MAG: hypothetical protein WC789_06255 [Lentisphaeria bacterium]